MLLSWHDFPNQFWKDKSLFYSKFGKLTNFPNPNLASPLTGLSIIMLLGKSYSYSCMSLVCACIYPYLVQFCTNPIQLYIFWCRHRWTLELTGRRWSHPDVEHTSGLGRTSCIRGHLHILMQLNYRIELVEYVPLGFLSCFYFRHYFAAILASINLMQHCTISFIWWA